MPSQKHRSMTSACLRMHIVRRFRNFPLRKVLWSARRTREMNSNGIKTFYSTSLRSKRLQSSMVSVAYSGDLSHFHFILAMFNCCSRLADIIRLYDTGV